MTYDLWKLRNKKPPKKRPPRRMNYKRKCKGCNNSVTYVEWCKECWEKRKKETYF